MTEDMQQLLELKESWRRVAERLEHERVILQEQNKQLIEAIKNSITTYGLAYGTLHDPVKRLEDWEEDLKVALQQIQGNQEP